MDLLDCFLQKKNHGSLILDKEFSYVFLKLPGTRLELARKV